VVIDAIITWWFDLVKTVVSSFPNTPLPTNALNFGWISDMNYFLPISEMFGLFVAMFALGGVFVGTSLVIWVFVGILRGGSTKA
jgi:hypothetical protein